MKILQIVNPVVPFPPETIGGTERIVQYLIDQLVYEGHEVHLMGESSSKVSKEVTLHKIGTYWDQKNTLIKIWKHLLSNRYDAIHNHGRMIYLLPVLKGRTSKVQTFHMGELNVKSLELMKNLKPKDLFFAPCGSWITEKFKRYGGNWVTVNNGLPISKYSLGNSIPEEKAPMVIICRIGEGKGITDAISVANATNRKLIIAGKVGDNEHEKVWFRENVEAYCNENISFIGEVNDIQKRNLLQRAYCLIIPTKGSEAFNTTMIEANACGCPVISYNRFCFPEFIQNGINGFVCNNFNELVSVIPLIANIDRGVCRQIFEEKYTSEIMTKKYLSLYQKV